MAVRDENLLHEFEIIYKHQGKEHDAFVEKSAKGYVVYIDGPRMEFEFDKRLKYQGNKDYDIAESIKKALQQHEQISF